MSNLAIKNAQQDPKQLNSQTAINQQRKNNLALKQQEQLAKLPVAVKEEWIYCVAGHIKALGFDQVLEIACRASRARLPENYFMKALSRERYGY